MSDLWGYYEKCQTDGERRLARAVIERAILDANAKKDSYDRQMGRNFLTACNNIWRESLEAWCELAEIDANAVIRKYRAKWGKDGTRRIV